MYMCVCVYVCMYKASRYFVKLLKRSFATLFGAFKAL